MIEPLLRDRTVVGRLRVRGAPPDPLSVRLRVASLLESTDPRPGGLPPTAIVCIRTLRDPLPGTLPLWRSGARPPAAWERAVRSRIDTLARQAARPALGPVPADAEAVLFVDQAELLACLARDHQAGAVAGRWWWQSLFPAQAASGLATTAWQASPAHVPAALERLAEQRQAVRFVRTLADGDARALVEGMRQQYGVSALDGDPEAMPWPEPWPAAGEATATHTPAVHADPGGIAAGRSPGQSTAPTAGTRASSPTVSPLAPPWAARVPESAAAGLSVEQRCLLGLGLMLRREPVEVRAPEFAAAVRRWRRLAATTQTHAPHPAPPGPVIETPAAAEPPPPPTPPIMRSDAPPAASSGSDASPAPETPTASEVRSPVLDPALDPFDLLVDEWSAASADPEPLAALREATIETELGGIFYLLNLGLALGLYGDFTAPAEPGIALPIWDFLALLGRELLDNAPADDPVWPLLAALAGRDEDEMPGHAFEPPDHWRLPPEWLAPFAASGAGPGGWRWSAAGGRLRVAHPAGFLILDLPLVTTDPVEFTHFRGTTKDENAACSPSPRRRGGWGVRSFSGEGQARREIAAYQDVCQDEIALVPRRRLGAARRSDDALGRWLGWLLPYVRARLRQALGLRRAQSPGRYLLVQPARVFVTETHLDVVLGLAELPIGVRLAGLDRDPGWIPAAGRYAAFHFE